MRIDQSRIGRILIVSIILLGALVLSRSALIKNTDVIRMRSTEAQSANEDNLVDLGEYGKNRLDTTPLIVMEPVETCAEGQLFFTSLPAKCINYDGELITVPELPPPLILNQNTVP
ncbi:MAG: hypothetical protein DWQ07_01465 [Chloroflexi bacterium]|nr:MAG: hypothetical protein DWQ07_01465 [Chloroflexota bacterium]MBL1193835.1 hypothetical protein [Chloroflexota bacterium]NOH11129.1 hypothetical protein [Chloroflexota bacterium]